MKLDGTEKITMAVVIGMTLFLTAAVIGQTIVDVRKAETQQECIDEN